MNVMVKGAFQIGRISIASTNPKVLAKWFCTHFGGVLQDSEEDTHLVNVDIPGLARLTIDKVSRLVSRDAFCVATLLPLSQIKKILRDAGLTFCMGKKNIYALFSIWDGLILVGFLRVEFLKTD